MAHQTAEPNRQDFNVFFHHIQILFEENIWRLKLTQIPFWGILKHRANADQKNPQKHLKKSELVIE